MVGFAFSCQIWCNWQVEFVHCNGICDALSMSSLNELMKIKLMLVSFLKIRFWPYYTYVNSVANLPVSFRYVNFFNSKVDKT